MGEIKTIPDTKVILGKLKTLDYISMKGAIRTWLGGETVGWNAAASSVLRKTHTLERLNKFIEEEQLPVFVVDDFDFVSSFKIMLKL